MLPTKAHPSSSFTEKKKRRKGTYFDFPITHLKYHQATQKDPIEMIHRETKEEKRDGRKPAPRTRVRVKVKDPSLSGRKSEESGEELLDYLGQNALL
ncbi:predicted protein [Sclerotinia sclerotiorum 1980 UF-70]|uniref:Uncharacterized protein n=1 Tax=Sclerotinia sclerotiorum (strain ATCC 18683 / 1980 / Ss-1) TaxID=665079 RepID=A7EXC8_SCLS1|nr:predicted protein [Sclerotinia sclerotiorum 1980 UF-70]EDN94120.1 predicted protein [Sclerotinia sclerotiorum 1980 UF-70]